MKASDVEQRDFLLGCAAWQDTLLQSYRSLHVTIQGFLIAAGVAVLAIQLTGAVQDQGTKVLPSLLFNLVFTSLLLALFCLQRKTSSELEGAVSSRAADINFWHVETILSENALDPVQRKFTHFKRWQQAKRAVIDPDLANFLPPAGISRKVAEELVGGGIGHTRKVLDYNLFSRLQQLWIGLCVSSIVVSAWFGLLWCRA